MVPVSDIPAWWLTFVHNNAVRSRITRRTSQLADWIISSGEGENDWYIFQTISGLVVANMGSLSNGTQSCSLSSRSHESFRQRTREDCISRSVLTRSSHFPFSQAFWAHHKHEYPYPVQHRLGPSLVGKERDVKHADEKCRTTYYEV